MRTRELLKLATVLEGVPDEEFDMAFWDCGTTACALGWAARKGIGGLQRLQTTVGVVISHPKARVSCTSSAGEAAFGINEAQFCRVFFDARDRKDAIRKIRRMVRNELQRRTK